MKTVFLFACCMMFFHTGFTQTSTNSTNAPAEQIMFVQCNDIDFNKYSELVGQIKIDERFEISSACLPAHLLMIKVVQPALLNETTLSNFDRFAGLASSSNINSSSLLQGFNEQQFLDHCRAARTGN